ncbi:MAG: YkgJ family cysteine cluster protein [Cyclobacteriaceae bacterium]|nr:YkgJ family cysteine cluster protein [Cyclobacteriaceae bacterium]
MDDKMEYEAFVQRACGKKSDFEASLKQMKRMPDQQVDKLFHAAHQSAFATIDCLTCAFCCTYVGPRITLPDIRRISKALRLREADFERTYLKIDEDGDFVFRSMPCPFLLPDKKCLIYDDRPKACREYPHTDRKKMKQLFKLTLTNSACCPAVEHVLDELGSKCK